MHVHVILGITSIVVTMNPMRCRRPVVGKGYGRAYPGTSPVLGPKVVKHYVCFGVPHPTRRKMRS